MFGLDINLVLVLILVAVVLYLFFELRRLKGLLLNSQNNMCILETKVNKQNRHNLMPIFETNEKPCTKEDIKVTNLLNELNSLENTEFEKVNGVNLNENIDVVNKEEHMNIKPYDNLSNEFANISNDSLINESNIEVIIPNDNIFKDDEKSFEAIENGTNSDAIEVNAIEVLVNDNEILELDNDNNENNDETYDNNEENEKNEVDSNTSSNQSQENNNIEDMLNLEENSKLTENDSLEQNYDVLYKKYSSYTKKELREELQNRDVEFNTRSKKSILVNLVMKQLM